MLSWCVVWYISVFDWVGGLDGELIWSVGCVAAGRLAIGCQVGSFNRS